MKDSVFTKIIKGEIRCDKVYEDDKTIVFMDIHPIQPGHVLVVPKKQVSHFFELPEDDYSALMQTVKKAAARLAEVFPHKARICLIVEGLDMPDHAHIKLFPADNDEEFRRVPDMTAEPDHAALAAMAEKLAF